MPQCSKCGREISDYGLCSNCAEEVKRLGKLKNSAPLRKTVFLTCPLCGGRYCEPIGVEKYRCCECDSVFLAEEIKKE